MQNIIVFIGPSFPDWKLFFEETTEIKFAPPMKRGDIKKYSDFDSYIIIDGEFHQNLSVSPKEILSAIEIEKSVIGASSMGALRASELYCYGMIGSGWNFRYFMNNNVDLRRKLPT